MRAGSDDRGVRMLRNDRMQRMRRSRVNRFGRKSSVAPVILASGVERTVRAAIFLVARVIALPLSKQYKPLQCVSWRLCPI